MEPTGVSMLAAEELAPPTARIWRLLLPLLPPVLCMLLRVPRIPSIKVVSAGMARKLRIVELEEWLALGGLLPADGLLPCRHTMIQGCECAAAHPPHKPMPWLPFRLLQQNWLQAYAFAAC